MAHSASIGPYNPTTEPWENYEIRFDAWLAINKHTDDALKRAALIAEIGPECFAVLKDLTFPDKVTTKSYTDLMKLLEQHYSKTKTSVMDRLLLHKRKQQEGESVADYMAALKKIATNCDYGDSLNDRLRDAFTFGVRDERVLKRLLEASQKDNFTWTKATTLALAMELVDRDVTGMSHNAGADATAGKSGVSGSVQHVSHNTRGRGARLFNGHERNRGRTRGRNTRGFGRGFGRNYQSNYQSGNTNYQSGNQGNNQSTNASNQCSHCGENHPSFTCRFRNNTCFSCGRRGHIQKICRGNNRPRQGGSSVRYVDQENYDHNVTELSGDMQDLSLHRLFSMSEAATVPDNSDIPSEYRETLNINGKPVEFVIDTACPVTILSRKCYQDRFANVPLQEAKLRLCSYSKHSVPVLGCFSANVQYGTQVELLTIYVTDGDNTCLLGRQWLKTIKLDWQKVFAVRNVTPEGMQCLLRNFEDVFEDTQGLIQNFKADIRIKEDAKPLYFKPRPVPYSLKDQVSADLDKLESRGVISKIDHSEWAAPLVVVQKRDKTLRLCGDYKVTVNQVVQSDTYPLPNAEDLFASLAGGEIFTKLDLSAAYQQLELTEDSKQYLVVNTQKGLYRYNRLSYGVSTAPSIFQRVMDQILQGLEGVTCYLDDILIASSKSEHVQKVKSVFERLRKFGVKLKKAKCAFMMPRVTYLGHEISAAGVQPTNEKIKSINEMPAPKDLHELRILLGMVNYYAKFLPNVATLLAPWYHLLRKETTFHWSKECERVWSQVKQILTSDRVLVHFDPAKSIVLSCDASPVGLGCVLSHLVDGVERPIAYAARSLTDAERNYCQLEREGLAIIYGLTKFHKFVYGRHFIIETDNKPITRILGNKVGIPSLAASRLQRWALMLMAHDYELRYKKAQEHGNCDCLSRLPCHTDDYLASELPINHVSPVSDLPVDAKQIAEQSRKDPVISAAIEYTMKGWSPKCPREELQPYFTRRDQLSVDQGCLLWGSRVVVPPKFQERLLNEMHDTHPGIVRMKAMARAYIWFPGMDKDIEILVKRCPACQAMQKDAPPVPLIPWQYPFRCWERIHIDFADFDKKQYLIVVDSHSKWLEVKEMSSTTSYQTIKVLRQIFASYGFPEVLVSDNGPQLVSQEMEQFLKSNGVKHILSPPYHPASNGAAERSVQTVKLALKKYLLATVSTSIDLDRALQNFLLHYRNTPQGTTGRAPSELFLKRTLRTRFSVLKPDIGSTVHNKLEIQVQAHDTSVRKTISFRAGEIVRVKSVPQYKGLERYIQGEIVKQMGPYKYLVNVSGRPRFVHLDHLHPTGEMSYESGQRCVPTNYELTPRALAPRVPDRIPDRIPMPRSPERPSVPGTPGREAQQPHVPNINPEPRVVNTGPRKSSRNVRVPERLIETI